MHALTAARRTKTAVTKQTKENQHAWEFDIFGMHRKLRMKLLQKLDSKTFIQALNNNSHACHPRGGQLRRRG